MTNNQLESHNQKLKYLTQRYYNITEIFQNLLRFSDIIGSEFNHCVFMEEFTITVNLADTDIPGVHNIQSVCTQYADVTTTLIGTDSEIPDFSWGP